MATPNDVTYTPAPAALRHIPRGARIFIGSGAAAPLTLVAELAKRATRYVDHEVVSILTLCDAPYADPALASSFRHNAMFIGPNVRAAVEQGAADYTPIFLSEIPGMFRSRQMPLQVALVSVAPPEDGMCNLGVSVDIVKAAIESADFVVAEVNPRMPRLAGDSSVPLERFDFFVLGEHELPEMPQRAPDPAVEEIARHVRSLVHDGDTLQLGIGSIPDRVLRRLDDRADLGIHTEMLSDAYAALAEKGVITNARKTLHRGATVASFLLGTNVIYDYARAHPDAIHLYPSDHVNDPFVIAQIDNMVAVNTALQIDLTGQVCSDSIGERFYSGIGGQVDFLRGAARSRGGRPIIALPSTTSDGALSRIVPRLTRGAGVVTTRGDVHYVVTEFGVAYLHGKSVRERALALIEIAHPKFRPWLLGEAKGRRLVYLDQIEPEVRTPTYPDRFEKPAVDKEGEPLLLRPVRPSDEGRLHDLYYAMSDESLYKRFFQVRKVMPHATLQKLCNVDYEAEMSIVASAGSAEAPRIVGAASYTLDPAARSADVAFVVEDRAQGRGIGRLLLSHLMEIARTKGLTTFTADVLVTNGAMKHLFESVGGAQVGEAHEGIARYHIPLRGSEKVRK
ncbi:MAG TPA: GNAT family N-acetyltransferase [Phycisphaerae bacterium]|nr:GNAT family N-acetyltransferase [Phycisphaerae bacterium]